MSNQAYIPANEANRIVWLSHFAAKLPVHASALGISDDEVAATLADITFYDWIVRTWNQAIQQNALEATAYKNMIASGTAPAIHPLPNHVVFDQSPAVRMPGVLNRLANLVQRIKLNSGYSESTGQDLGIISGQDNTVHIIPEFSAAVERNGGMERVKILFTKYTHDGISIDTRRNNGDWEHLAIAMVKPWYDERTLQIAGTPEIREYRVCWWDKGIANGGFSPVQRITVGP